MKKLSFKNYAKRTFNYERTFSHFLQKIIHVIIPFSPCSTTGTTNNVEVKKEHVKKEEPKVRDDDILCCGGKKLGQFLKIPVYF